VEGNPRKPQPSWASAFRTRGKKGYLEKKSQKKKNLPTGVGGRVWKTSRAHQEMPEIKTRRGWESGSAGEQERP